MSLYAETFEAETEKETSESSKVIRFCQWKTWVILLKFNIRSFRAIKYAQKKEAEQNRVMEQELTPAQNLNVEWESSPVISENPFLLEVGDKNTKLFLFLISVILIVILRGLHPDIH